MIIDFQPMPKRFMVWDKEEKEFITFKYGDGTASKVVSLEYLIGYFDADDLNSDEYVFIQSTNLFDKDGQEIFEGSLIVDPDEGMFMWEMDGCRHSFECGGDYVRVVGHILSNPELLEGE